MGARDGMAGVSRFGHYGRLRAEQFRQAREEQDMADFQRILAACTRQIRSYILSQSLEVDFVLETVQ